MSEPLIMHVVLFVCNRRFDLRIWMCVWYDASLCLTYRCGVHSSVTRMYCAYTARAPRQILSFRRHFLFGQGKYVMCVLADPACLHLIFALNFGVSGVNTYRRRAADHRQCEPP